MLYSFNEEEKKFNKPPLEPDKFNKEVLNKLSLFQKTLLITDGTVTELLEFFLDEKIKVKKLEEEIEQESKNLPLSHKSLIKTPDFPVLSRKVLLQGKTSLNTWLYAESSILINNLTSGFRKDLLVSHQPIGKLWSKYRLETYKTNFTIQKEKADKKLADYLTIPINSEVLSRTYCVYSQGKKTMIITEKFSSESFKN